MITYTIHIYTTYRFYGKAKQRYRKRVHLFQIRYILDGENIDYPATKFYNSLGKVEDIAKRLRITISKIVYY